MSNLFCHKFRQWCENGLFELLLHLVNANAEHSTLLELDSIFCKVHILINAGMQLLNAILTGGNIYDSEPAIELFDNIQDETHF